jgi:WD40 repeat protein
MKQSSPKYIHAIQSRLILEPIASQLQAHFGQKLIIAAHIRSIIASLQTDFRGLLHYGGGNSIGLLRHLDIDLTGYNFANLPILQVSFQAAILHNVNFSGANLTKSIFTHNFGGVSATAFSPDSQLAASGEYNGNLYMCSINTKRLKFKFQGHTNLIWSIAFSPDGRVLASASQDATIRLWDVTTGQGIHVLQADSYHVFSLSFSPTEVDLPSGKAYVLATAHGDGSIRKWNVTTGEQIDTRSRHPKQFVSVRFSPDGQLLATCSGDGTIRLWDHLDSLPHPDGLSQLAICDRL